MSEAEPSTRADLGGDETPEEGGNGAAPRPPGWRRRLRWSLLGFVGGLAGLVLAAALGAVLLQRSGAASRWIEQRLRGALPGELSIGATTGIPGARVTAVDVDYLAPPGDGAGPSERLHVHVARLDLEWRPSALLLGRVAIRRLALEGVSLELPPASAGSSGAPELPDLRLPLMVAVRELEVRDVDWRQGAPTGAAGLSPAPDPTAGHLDRVLLRRALWRPAGGPLTFSELAIAAPSWEVAVSGALTPVGTYPLRVDGRWEAALGASSEGSDIGGGQQPLRLAGVGSVSGELAHLELDQRLTAATGTALLGATPAPGDEPAGVLEARALGTLDDLLGTPAYELELTAPSLQWPLSGTPRFSGSRVTLQARGSFESVRFSAAATLAPLAGLPETDWQGEGTVDGQHLSMELRTTLLQGAVDGTLEVRWPEAVEWQATVEAAGVDPGGRWSEWPGRLDLRLVGSGSEPAAGARRADLRLERLQGELRGYPVAGTAQLTVDGDTLRLAATELRSGRARLRANGDLAPSWGLDWSIRAPELEELWPDASGDLQASGTLRGTADRPTVALELAGSGLAMGDLAADTLTGEATLGLFPAGTANASVRATGFEAAARTVDSATATVSGRTDDHRLALAARRGGDRLELQAEGALRLDEPGSDLLPQGWSGRLQRLDLVTAKAGSWRLSQPGSSREADAGPGVALEVDRSGGEIERSCWRFVGNDTADGRARTASVCVGGSFRLDGPWRLAAETASAPAASLAPLLPPDLSLEGTVSATLDASGTGQEGIAGELEVTSSSLRTELAGVDPDNPIELRWRDLRAHAILGDQGLRAELGTALDSGRVDASVSMPDLRLPLDRPLDDQTLQGRIAATLPDLRLVEALLAGATPTASGLDGRLRADLTLAGKIGRPRLLGDLHLQDGRGHLTGWQAQEGAEPIDLAFDHAEAVFSAREGGATLSASLRLGEPPGSLQTRIELPGFDTLGLAAVADQPLTGTLAVSFDSLAPVEQLVPQLSDAHGKLGGTLSLGGTLGAAQLGGRLDLAEFSARVEALGLELEDGQLSISGDLGRSLRLTGSVRSGKGALSIDGTVASEGTRYAIDLGLAGTDLTVSDTAEVRLRADPDLQIHAEPGAIDVRGEVTLPWARIELRELPETAASVSPDVVVVGREAPSATARVTPDRITGQVRVRFGDEFRFSGFGFEAQPRGSLLVNVPVRGVTTATGQLRIDGGTYRAYGQDLKVESGRVLFAGGPIGEPGLDVVAYRTVDQVKAGVEIHGTLARPSLALVANRPLTDSDILHYMVLGRPPGQSTSAKEGDLLSRAAAALSLRGGNQLASRIAARYGIDDLQLRGGLEDASLVIGKFLSPRLYVSYGVGLFEPISTFSVRYVLTPRLTLLATKGRESGGDLLYTIERGKRPGEPAPTPQKPP